MKKNSGFTLIELLVVISIISLLSSIIVAGLQEAKIKANDAANVEGLKSLQNSLELYQLDHNRYPRITTANNSYSANSDDNESWSQLTSQLDPYIKLMATYPNALFLYESDLIRYDPDGYTRYCDRLSPNSPWISAGPDAYIIFVISKQDNSSLGITGGNIIPCPFTPI